MKVTIQNTSEVVMINGIPARIWEGESESGIKVHCYITRIAVAEKETRLEDFERELEEQAPPSAELQIIPLRMIL